MPPRSVCLNVFTTSLGNGIGIGKEREVDVEVKEVGDKMEGVESVAERGRHDSVQGSPNDSIATTPSYTGSIANSAYISPIATTHTDTTPLPLNMGCFHSKERGQNLTQGQDQGVHSTGTLAPTCSTCAQPPALGLSLLRCSRCKNAYYCSKTCQKAAWKLHKYDCERAGAAHSPSPSSALQTPDMSTPASPVADELAPTQPDGSSMTTENATPAPLPLPYTRRRPQSSEAWASHYDVIDVLFPNSGILWLRMYLMEAFSLYANEHGGLGPALEDGLAEYRDYLDAVSERVRTPLQLDETRKEDMIETMRSSPLPNSPPGAVREALRNSEGNELVAEYDRINEVVYGSHFSEEQMQS